jgi:hypothetical protein
MVVGERYGVNCTDALGAQRCGEVVRAGDGGKRQDALAGDWQSREIDASADGGESGSGMKERGDSRLNERLLLLAHKDEVGALEGGEWLPAVAGGEQGVFEVLSCDQNDIEGAGELAVLETVVEEVDGAGVRSRLSYRVGFCGQAGGVAIGAHPYGCSGAL